MAFFAGNLIETTKNQLKQASFRGVDFATLEKVVRQDQKSRYHLAYEPWYCKSSSWWIRANPESRESETNPVSFFGQEYRSAIDFFSGYLTRFETSQVGA
jgi:RNA:NAD 2'-phosphotransferase (TPT1/KptA family)